MKQKILLASLFFIISGSLLGSCSFKNDNNSSYRKNRQDDFLPPNNYHELLNLSDTQIEEKLKSSTDLTANERFWLKYRLFDLIKDLSSQKACSLLNDIESESIKYSLSNLLIINKFKHCSDDVHEIKNLSWIEEKVYKDLLSQYHFKKANQHNDLKNKITYGLEIANLEKNRKDKQQFYLALEKEVIKSSDDALINLFNSALKKEFPRYLAPTDTNRIEIANDLIKDREFSKAQAQLNYIVNNKNSRSEEIQKAFKTLFRIEKSSQDKKNQEQLLTKWWNWLIKAKKQKNVEVKNFDSWFSEVLTLKARWHWTEGDPTKATKLLTENHKRIKDPFKKEEIFYTLGRIFDEKKDFENAKENYELSNKYSTQKGVVFEKNLWSLAWLEYKYNQYLECQNHLELLISKLKDDSDSKYRYWLAQSYLAQQKFENYKETIAKLREKEPLSFYSLLTYKDSKEKIPLIQASSNSQRFDFLKEQLATALSPEDLKLILWHISLRQNSFLKEWAKIISDKDSAHFLPSLILFSKAELYSNLITSINLLTSDQKKELLQKYPELLFPKPYWDLVQLHANKRNIPASFVYSIMRQESAFDPFARSPVDAMGLLQLMPALGKKLAKEENIPFVDEFALFNEAININLGAKELSQLLQRNKNNYIAAIAGYNASPAAFQGWIKSRYRPNVVEFIEEIPYEETRTYIKLIIRNMIFYDRIYFQKQDFNFPDFLLSLN